MKRKGLIIFAHGARDSSWRQPFDTLANSIASSAPDTEVMVAFLERMEPDLSKAIATLHDLGILHVTICPAFMAAGKHLRSDFPILLSECSQAHPHMTFHITPILGEVPAVQNAMHDWLLAQVRDPAQDSSSDS